MHKPLLKKLELEHKALRSILPKGQATGESINITDSSNFNFEKFNIFANSKQETRIGKNLLFNSNKGKTGWSFNLKDGTSIVEADIDEKGVHLNCTKPSTGWEYIFFTIRKTDLLKLEPNSEYTLSFNLKTNMPSSSHDVMIKTASSLYVLSNVGKFNNSSDNQWHHISVQITTNDLTEEINSQGLYITEFNYVGDIYINNIQLEKGNQATEYEEYGATPSFEIPNDAKSTGDNGNINFQITNNAENKQNITIPVQEPFRAIGENRDTFIKENGKWYEKHFIKRKILNGTEYYEGVRNQGWYLQDNNLVKALDYSNLIKCNYYKTLKNNTVYNSGITGYSDPTNKYAKQNWFYFMGNDFSSSADLKAKIKELYDAETPFYIDYVLAEPQLIECTEEQIKILNKIEEDLHTYKNATNIFSEDEVSPIFEVEYIKDLETILTKG